MRDLPIQLSTDEVGDSLITESLRMKVKVQNLESKLYCLTQKN